MARTRQLVVPPPAAEPDPDPPGDGDEDEEEDDDDRSSLGLADDNLDAAIRDGMIAMFERVLNFKNGAATALYDEQQITDVDALRELDDTTIKELCRAIAKAGHSISQISQNRLKLLVWWTKHMWRTSREIDDLTDVQYDDIKLYQSQKTFEDDLVDAKEPAAPTMTLSQATAAACFTQMTTHLDKCRGVTGIPLGYVVRPTLKGPFDAPEDGPEDHPPYGAPESPYPTIDAELSARARILRHDLTHAQLAAPLDTLEANGPFDPAFLVDSTKVFEILHSSWGTSQPWTHARTLAKVKNGRKAFRLLHSLLLGGQQLVTSGSAIMTKLQSFRYDGDRRGFGFDKYVALHVGAHNDHDELQAYDVAPLEESLKILWFQNGIQDKSFDAVRAAICANPGNYTTFTAVQEAYVNFKLQQKATEPPRARQVASFRAGRRDNAPRRGGAGRGRGGGDRKKNLPSQKEVDACTHIVDKDYPTAEYNAFTPAEKQRLYQLRNPGKEPGTGPTRHDRARGKDSSGNRSIASASSSGTKRTADDSQEEPPADGGDQNSWGRDRNRDNPAVQGRQHGKSQKIDKDT